MAATTDYADSTTTYTIAFKTPDPGWDYVDLVQQLLDERNACWRERAKQARKLKRPKWGMNRPKVRQ